ncbi:hypothetical protein BS17DRAFT_777801 [Gyrodon lividus]|nr:hypothetical protein BS17DRAFT_777801 [Gyrodon lividus]
MSSPAQEARILRSRRHVKYAAIYSMVFMTTMMSVRMVADTGVWKGQYGEENQVTQCAKCSRSDDNSCDNSLLHPNIGRKGGSEQQKLCL